MPPIGLHTYRQQPTLPVLKGHFYTFIWFLTSRSKTLTLIKDVVKRPTNSYLWINVAINFNDFLSTKNAKKLKCEESTKEECDDKMPSVVRDKLAIYHSFILFIIISVSKTDKKCRFNVRMWCDWINAPDRSILEELSLLLACGFFFCSFSPKSLLSNNTHCIFKSQMKLND